MSRLAEIKDLTKLPQVLEEYEQALQEAETLIKLKGKNLEKANQENPAWLLYFDQKRIELGTLEKYLKARVDATRSAIFKAFTESYNRELSDRAKDKYIDGDPKYLSINELYLEVEELHDKYQSVVEAFRARGFALRNITEIRVHALEETII